jgi:hypothetical protein
MNKKPVAHIVFINDAPRSVMLVEHAIELCGEVFDSTPVFESVQKDWYFINEVQFKTLAKKFGYEKRKVK